jgi:Family of unknown function (DUF6010)
MLLGSIVATVAIAIAIALLFIALAGALPEPNRQHAMVIVIAVGAGVYQNGGFGPAEPLFQVAVGYCAYRGLRSYRWIGIAWLLHTGWDILHHRAGHPIALEVEVSSLMCAIVDPMLALWMFAGAPSIWRRRVRTQHLTQAATEGS